MSQPDPQRHGEQQPFGPPPGRTDDPPTGQVYDPRWGPGEAPPPGPGYGLQATHAYDAPYGAPGYGPPNYGPPPGYGPPPYQTGYPAPGYGPYPVSRPTNGMAIASLVLGILWLYWVGSILALVFGYVARQQIAERGESGHGMAVAGIVLGWIGVGVLAVGLLFFMVGAAASAV